MKTLLASLSAILLLATAGPSRAAETIFKVTVSGTVQTQTIVSPSDGRIHTAPLNEKRIFQEYGVSEDKYEMVLSTNAGLELVPRHSADMLPTIQILTFGTSVQIVNTKAHIFKIESALTPGPAANSIFDGISGELLGTAAYTGPFQSSVFKKLNFSITARGNDPAGGIGYSLLKFKVVTNGIFVQH